MNSRARNPYRWDARSQAHLKYVKAHYEIFENRIYKLANISREQL